MKNPDISSNDQQKVSSATWAFVQMNSCIRNKSGGPSWHGMIYEPGIIRFRSYDIGWAVR